jgi:hypothetical protein
MINILGVLNNILLRWSTVAPAYNTFCWCLAIKCVSLEREYKLYKVAIRTYCI